MNHVLAGSPQAMIKVQRRTRRTPNCAQLPRCHQGLARAGKCVAQGGVRRHLSQPLTHILRYVLITRVVEVARLDGRP